MSSNSYFCFCASDPKVWYIGNCDTFEEVLQYGVKLYKTHQCSLIYEIRSKIDFNILKTNELVIDESLKKYYIKKTNLTIDSIN